MNMLNELCNLKKELNYCNFETYILSLENKIEGNMYCIEDYDNIDDFIYNMIYETGEYWRDYATGKEYSYALNRELLDDEYYKLESFGANVGFEYIKNARLDIEDIQAIVDIATYGQQEENYSFYLENEDKIKYNIILDKVIEEYKQNNMELDIDVKTVDNLIHRAIQDDTKMQCENLKDTVKEILEESREYAFRL